MTTKKRVEQLEKKVSLNDEPIEEIIIQLIGMDKKVTETFRVDDQGLLVKVCNAENRLQNS